MRCWLVLVVALVGFASGGRAQVPAFEAATVRRSFLGPVGTETLFQTAAFRAQNHTIRDLVANAYRVQTFRVVGGPEWIRDERFDVIAKAPGETTRDGLSAMLRTLLTERFKLAAHQETREMPIYALVMARDDRRLGAQLRPASAAACRPTGPNWVAGALARCGALLQNPGVFLGRSVELARLAADMSQNLDRIVVDRTELTGLFDLDLKWEPGLTDTAAPGLFTALPEQLGLKLDAQRGPVDVLVIDSVAHPLPD